jgi:hypothetical protein
MRSFLEQYDYLIKEMARVTKKGRINAIHCTDLFKYNGALSDFPADIIKLHEKKRIYIYEPYHNLERTIKS